MKVSPAPASKPVGPKALEGHDVPVLSTGLDLHLARAIEGLNFAGETKGCIGHWNFQICNEVVTVPGKYRMRPYRDLKVNVPGRPARKANLTLSGEVKPKSVAHPSRYFYI